MTPRQERILELVMLEFMKSAHAVGSISITDKYNLGVSPATVRNEMADLLKQGFLKKEHFSSGRIPTTVGVRYYIDNLLVEGDFSYKDEMEVKENLYTQRFNRDKLLKRATEILSKSLHYTSIAISGDSIFYYGISTLMDYPEFEEISVLKNIISVLEDYSLVENIFSKGVHTDGDIKILIGEESGFNSFEMGTLVFTGFRLHKGEQGYIGVFGPLRMEYSKVIPTLKYVTSVLNEVTSGW